jgi:hypothetical protein
MASQLCSWGTCADTGYGLGNWVAAKTGLRVLMKEKPLSLSGVEH